MCKRVMMDPEIKPGKDVCGDIQEDMKAQRKEDGSNGFQVPVGPKDFWSPRVLESLFSPVFSNGSY